MITKQTPMRSVGVGSLYQNFFSTVTPGTYEAEVFYSDVVATIKTSEERSSESVYGSNKIYEEDIVASPAMLEIEVLAYPPLNVARMRGNVVAGGFVTHNRYDEGEYFAQGVVYPKRGGHLKYVWYPKCRLVDTNKESQTKNDGGNNSQNRTLSIQTYEYNDAGDWQIEYDTELLAAGVTPMTEAQFFAAVLVAVPGTTVVINKAILNALIVQAIGLTEADYTVETWGTLESAQAAAILVANDEEATQSEVDGAANTLSAAIEGLIEDET